MCVIRFARRSFCSLAGLVVVFVASELSSLPSVADDSDFPGFEALMTEQEFRDAGLEKLTADQREALNKWLIRYTGGEAQVLQETEAVRDAKKDYEIVSRIAGEFNGWSGKTVFTLENGQRWQQRVGGRYVYRGEDNPEVTISRNFMGFYKLTIVGDERGVGVSRLE